MTVSVLQTLATRPSGSNGTPLTLEELGRYCSSHCNATEDKNRENDHKDRLDFYSDGGVDLLKALVNAVFRDEAVKRLRLAWAEYAIFNNCLKRIVNEVSSLYTEPARRSVNGNENNDAYQSLLEQVQFDTAMQEANRRYNLSRIALVGFRVRTLPDDSVEPVVDILTPAHFRALLHPNDSSLPIGYLVRTGSRPARQMIGDRVETVPGWTLWTDHERVQLTETFTVIADTYKPHEYGVCNYVPIARGFRQNFWPGCEGRDLLAAAVNVAFNELLLLKETKSATKQTTVAGDQARMARGQSLDSEVPSELPEGTSMATVDMSMDLGMFRDNANHIIESAANNYGMSGAQVRRQGVQSADASEMLRIPLRELRREQQPLFRLFERRFANVMASVLAKDAPALKFTTEGWRIDFGEAQTPMMPSDEVDLFLKERAAGIDNTVAFVMRQNPDMDEDQARNFIADNIDTETWRVGLMKNLMAMSGAMGTAQTGTPSNAQPDNTSSPVTQAERGSLQPSASNGRGVGASTAGMVVQ